ncbi:MAG: hypothetical protein IJB89_09435, partial [Akkermansia sp.]|nr:hypothetical protein [Akkermansia sp.]
GEGLIAVLPPSPHPARAVWAPSETFLGGFWVLLLFLHFSIGEITRRYRNNLIAFPIHFC